MSEVKKGYNLTEGSILNRLLLVAVPIMGTQLMQMTYNLTDIFWLGRVSSDVVAASGTAGMYLWLSNAFLFIGKTGSEIGVSQQLGKGDLNSARKYSQNSIALALLLGILFAAIAILFRFPLIGFFGIREQHVALDAARYLSVTALAVPCTFVSGAIAGTFNACGNSRIPFFINATGLLINMLLDPLLIFNCKMGIMGAAVATSTAQVIVCLLSLTAICWHRTQPLGTYSLRIKPDRRYIRQIFKWSMPVAMESMLFTTFSMLTSRFIASFGADAIAVNMVGTQIESLSWLIGGGFSSAVTAYVGQNFGAGMWSRIRQGVRLGAMTMIVWGIIVTLLLIFAGKALFSIFLPDPALSALGAQYLHILAACQIVCTLEGIGAGFFRGTGRTIPPSIASISSNGMRVILCYFLSRTALGPAGVWIGITIGANIRGLWVLIWFLYTLRRQPRDDAPQTACTEV